MPTKAQRLHDHMGRDLRLDYAQRGGFFEDADLATGRGRRGGFESDAQVVAGLDALTQAVANRLKTRRGELADLGHPDYGSRHHELMGAPNVQRTRDLIKLYVLQALRDEPRIERVINVSVDAERDPPREVVRITLSAAVRDRATPLNLVIPFSLGLSL